MKLVKDFNLYFLIILIAFWIMVFSLWDIIFDKGWSAIILGAYALIIIFTLILTILELKEPVVQDDPIQDFEKKIKGGLYHFKCQNCNGIFAIKRSRKNDKKPIKMNCPDCGKVGIIPSVPSKIKAEIPEKKSPNINFECSICGEAITIWAEGAEMYPYTHIYNCPFCGEQKEMNRI